MRSPDRNHRGWNLPTSIRLKCESCGLDAMFQAKADILDVSAETIAFTEPCPACRGSLTCPGGYYRKDSHNVLTRIAAFMPPSTAVN